MSQLTACSVFFAASSMRARERLPVPRSWRDELVLTLELEFHEAKTWELFSTGKSQLLNSFHLTKEARPRGVSQGGGCQDQGAPLPQAVSHPLLTEIGRFQSDEQTVGMIKLSGSEVGSGGFGSTGGPTAFLSPCECGGRKTPYL